jgi:hypothetical protein
MTEFKSDCLVFKIEEYDTDLKEIDMTLYVLYDKKRHEYIISGRRKWTPKNQSCTYSFTCEYAHELVDFIQYVICKTNKVHETLFNYDNLPYDSKDITFEFLNDYDHRDYELSGYDNQKLRRKDILRKLRMLRSISNKYV